MPAANHIFLPWVQPGAIANVPDQFVERLSDDQPAAVRVGVGFAINGRPIEKSVRLYGPGDVTGIDPQQVVRLEPQPRTSDFEPNYFPFIEFDRPDFPWLFSPAKADSQGRLRPWLVLVVVRRQPGVELRPAGDTPLPVLEIKAPARPDEELPDLTESHFWAHAQTTGASKTELRAVLESDPARTISRLMCARRLQPLTQYLACVVPAYDVGRAAGLGEPTIDTTSRPSWRSGAQAPSDIRLPVYYSWEFRTSDGGDFEALVRRLEPRELPADVGKRPMDISRPGFALQPQPEIGAPGTVIGLEGALRVVDTESDVWIGETRVPFQNALAPILNTPWKLATTRDGGDPIVAPPIYGAWHAGVHTVTAGEALSPVPWMNEINLDPRLRAAAAMGTAVVQAEQEALMASAWEQLGAAEAINQRLRQAQLSRAVNERYHTKAFAKFTPDAFMRVVAPARSRFTIPPVETGGQGPVLFVQQLSRSFVPPAAISPGVRKLSRPRGAFNRRYSRAGTSGARSLFTFFNKPGLTGAFAVAPGSRGYVGIDAVTEGVLATIGPNGMIWVLEPAPHWERMPVGFMEMTQTLRFQRLRPAGLAGAPGTASVGFPEAALAHAQYLEQLFGTPMPLELRSVLKPEVNALALASLEPATTVAQAITSGIETESPAGTADDDLEPIMDAPEFPQPMYAALRDRSPAYVFPGLERVPPDTVQLLQTNNRFIESFMVGLNSEMGRELLWRGYPTDQRGTPFRQFWDATSSDADDTSDIPPIHEWRQRTLGSNVRSAREDHLVLLLRGELLRRYPGVIIYAVKGVVRDGRRVLATDSPAGVTRPIEIHPLFRGSLDADVTFVGFNLTRDAALAGDGWFFVLQQQPTEPRFGLDDDPFGPGESGVVPELETWNDLSWGHIAGNADVLNRLSHLRVTDTSLTPTQPVKGTWGRNAAHMALITKQLPVRVAIHASELLP